MSKKFVYNFKEGNKQMKDLLGGKGANLAEMSHIGLPVPPGFTVTTEACTKYYEDGQKINKEIEDEIFLHMGDLEKEMKKVLGDDNNPLLVSVRSGSKFSMPGMMDTILNLGLNDVSVEGLAKSTGNRRFAYDSYRRFIQMFSGVVLEIDKAEFENILTAVKKAKGIHLDTELDEKDLLGIINEFKKLVKKLKGRDFPQKPREQLLLSAEAVFRSWNNSRAILYRNLNDIPHDLGTAVNIQSMVFGNMGDTSGTGVAFTRNPATGENKLFGEFLMNAQGEDVVAGIRTPQTIDQLAKVMPSAYQQFVEITKKLEEHYKDMQDIEFTIENTRLFILQTRSGKRTAQAAINITVDLVKEGLIDKNTALLRVEPNSLDQLLHPTFDPKEIAKATKLTSGLPASPGAASGKIYFHAEDVAKAAKAGEKAILVRQETSPEDLEGMVAAKGILTARGGMTSHAAVVARGMGKCCVAGCNEIAVDEVHNIMTIAGKKYKEGDSISLDGSTGAVYLGEVKTMEAELTGNFGTLMEWANEAKVLQVRANADGEKDALVALKFGAVGIGLCRTEHMFFEADRILAVRQMILADNVAEREVALAKVLPFQKNDFIKIFRVMHGLPVCVRLLDPPLHEFVPHALKEMEQLAKELGVTVDKIKNKVDSLHEFNPMLGHRGCRLAITFPEIYNMQVRAIIEAAIEVMKTGVEVTPEIMVPLVATKKELSIIKADIIKVADEIIAKSGLKIKYKVGTMIELPRACVVADKIAEEAEFFSFGTNDLTQTAFGFSRDDAGKFINDYKTKGIFEKDPFQRLDQEGVGDLISTAIKLGKSVKKDLKIGICGEHGGEPDSIAFCHRIGLTYVSCSPYRVPIAILAAARAAILGSNYHSNDK